MIRTTALLAVAGLAAGSLQAQVTVGIDESSAPWLGFMNVFELPVNGGGFIFGSGWGVPDLSVTFDDVAQTMTFVPNSIGDPNEFWYQEAPGGDPGDPNNGGPGAPGNKAMEANLFQEVGGGAFAGQTLTFEGTLLTDTTTDHDVFVFIREFTADFSSLIETKVELTSTGSFSISQAITNDPTSNVQWGVQMFGENVWVTDLAPFGEAVFATIPSPGSAAILGLAGLATARRRRA